MKYQDYYKTILDELKQVFERIDTRQIDQLMDAIIKAKRLFLIGVGREGLSTRAFAMRLMHLGKEVHWIWDDTTPSLGKDDLLIVTSGSGEIGHLHYVAEQGKLAGATLAVVTGTPDRKTPEMADMVLWVPACVFHGKDNVVPSIQLMGNLFEQSLLIVFDMIVMMLAEKLGVAREEMVNRHRNVE
ncbi:MAG: 6-phospho-3-hexuloisomerase [Anaerolineae bacterium]|jgi:6-phospho-3-hexuloisomerase|nr:MAG: 6-phospho-3-hexuloisomerase [Anaerolineae bacterium]